MWRPRCSAVAPQGGMIVGVMRLARIIVQVLADLWIFVWLLLWPEQAVVSANLFLRKQLAMYRKGA